jgi:trehalose 6-phosphate phosphatase
VVPAAFRAQLATLAPRLALLAFVTGRDVRQAQAMVGVEGAAYVGLHGFDVLATDDTVLRDPAAEPYVEAVQRMARRVRGLDAERLGLIVENKGPVLDLHYRQAADPADTLAVLEEQVLAPARDLGLAVTTGHRLVEVRPPEPVDKGTAVRSLLDRVADAGRPVRVALFFGDDLTDCHGFDAVHRWAAAGEGRLSLAVAALTDETPPQVKDGADVWVAATPGVAQVLRLLLVATGA